MNCYDLIYINKCDYFSNIKNNALIIINLIVYNEGLFLKTEFCGKRDFSYKIKNYNSGYYIIISFLLNTNFLKDLFFFLKNNESILRFLILNLKNKDNFISTFFTDKIIKKRILRKKRKNDNPHKKKKKKRQCFQNR